MKSFLDEIMEINVHESDCKCSTCKAQEHIRRGSNTHSILEEILMDIGKGRLPVVHFEKSSLVSRNKKNNLASPLNEPGQPLIKNPETCHYSDSSSLLTIVDWLNVENSKRYKPENGKTYCNIYAYDYCTFAGAYLPRVWWTSQAIKRLQNGENVDIEYGKTVRELNANSLFDWMAKYGSQFWWKEIKSNGKDFSQIQNHANNGDVVVLVFKNEPGRSGHILAIIPESNKGMAKRENGIVVLPVHSQAGRFLFSYSDHDPKSSRNLTSLFNSFAKGKSNVKIYYNPINCQ